MRFSERIGLVKPNMIQIKILMINYVIELLIVLTNI